MSGLEFVPAESRGFESDPFATPQYRENGLNETLRIDGFSYIYDPEYNVWIGSANDALTGSEIHAMIWEGVHRVLPWIPEEAPVVCGEVPRDYDHAAEVQDWTKRVGDPR